MVTLTPRQQQVLRLYSLGDTDLEIAGELGISVETVKEHGKELRGRLGARTRGHAVAIGLHQGLIRP